TTSVPTPALPQGMTREVVGQELMTKLRDQIHSKKVLEKAYDIFNNKSPNRGMQYLIRQGVVTNEPKVIAAFMLSNYQKLTGDIGLSKKAIGQYVGRKGKPYEDILSEYTSYMYEDILSEYTRWVY
ncbi:hypothetical protein KIPB_004153, partial [Kipferlia bialata]